MSTMTALVGMGELPSTCTVAVAPCESTSERTSQDGDVVVMVTADGDAFIICQGESKFVENLYGTFIVNQTTTVAPASLAEVVKEGRNSDAVGGQAACMGAHMVIDLKRVGGEAATFLVMAMTTLSEVVRCLDVVDDGFDAWTLGGTEDSEDPLSIGVGYHVRLDYCGIVYYQ